MDRFNANTRKLLAGSVVAAMLVALGSLPAMAAVTAPAVTTGAVSATTGTTATVSGSIDPNGSSTSWYVAYGITSSYGGKSAAHTLPAGSAPVAVSTTLGKLAPQTTYHYEFVATNSAGTITGTDGIFTTTAVPQALTGVVSQIGADRLELTGTVVPNGQSTSYYFELGTSTTYTIRTPTTSVGSSNSDVAVSALVTNLTASTLYHYRLVAVSSSGHAYGKDNVATTASSVTLQTSAQVITWGASATLSGVVASTATGVTVAVVAEPAGTTAFAGLGTTTTTAGGAWSFTVKPSLRTLYEVAVAGGYSPQIGIAVRPQVTLSKAAANGLAVRIVAGIPFANRVAQVQKLVDGQWALVRHFALGANGRITMPSSWLPKGKSTLRVAIGSLVLGQDQAGTGYLAGYSGTIAYSR